MGTPNYNEWENTANRLSISNVESAHSSDIVIVVVVTTTATILTRGHFPAVHTDLQKACVVEQKGAQIEGKASG